ncbi:MAG: hypothetical protein IT204_15355 [Fimbriimonadaceae bacterium]|nr:hypothetical protein [Fimbriimonadaceae bacterium]
MVILLGCSTCWAVPSYVVHNPPAAPGQFSFTIVDEGQVADALGNPYHYAWTVYLNGAPALTGTANAPQSVAIDLSAVDPPLPRGIYTVDVRVEEVETWDLQQVVDPARLRVADLNPEAGGPGLQLWFERQAGVTTAKFQYYLTGERPASQLLATLFDPDLAQLAETGSVGQVGVSLIDGLVVNLTRGGNYQVVLHGQDSHGADGPPGQYREHANREIPAAVAGAVVPEAICTAYTSDTVDAELETNAGRIAGAAIADDNLSGLADGTFYLSEIQHDPSPFEVLERAECKERCLRVLCIQGHGDAAGPRTAFREVTVGESARYSGWQAIADQPLLWPPSRWVTLVETGASGSTPAADLSGLLFVAWISCHSSAPEGQACETTSLAHATTFCGAGAALGFVDGIAAGRARRQDNTLTTERIREVWAEVFWANATGHNGDGIAKTVGDCAHLAKETLLERYSNDFGYGSFVIAAGWAGGRGLVLAPAR